MINFSTYCSHIFRSFFSVHLLLVFGGQHVCIWKCFESRCACFDTGTTGNNLMVIDT